MSAAATPHPHASADEVEAAWSDPEPADFALPGRRPRSASDARLVGLVPRRLLYDAEITGLKSTGAQPKVGR